MHNRAVVGFVLIPTFLVAVVAAAVTSRERIADRFETPNDDPQFFCSAPDPSPVAEAAGTQLLLQGCAAGKTYKLERGATLAIDLASGGHIDSGAQFHDLTVSDPSVLQAVSAPKSIKSTRDGVTELDYIAVYKGAHSGRVTISALYRVCYGGCTDSMRWETTVEVG